MTCEDGLKELWLFSLGRETERKHDTTSEICNMLLQSEKEQSAFYLFGGQVKKTWTEIAA